MFCSHLYNQHPLTVITAQLLTVFIAIQLVVSFVRAFCTCTCPVLNSTGVYFSVVPPTLCVGHDKK